MGNIELTEYINAEINPLIESMGYRIVEMRFGASRKMQHLSIVIYRPEGVSINDCSRVAKKMRPKLEIEEFADLSVEVSSPGIDRVFKSLDELIIFKGRGVKVLLKEDPQTIGGNPYVGGVIGEVSEKDFTLIKDKNTITISKDNVKRIKLDHTEEVSKTKCQQS
jgi:ribosome maturation factor RimP